MTPDTVGRWNGAGVIMRLITPLMVGICIAMLGFLLNSITGMRTSLDNHLQHDVSDIKERLASIEAKMERR